MRFTNTRLTVASAMRYMTIALDDICLGKNGIKLFRFIRVVIIGVCPAFGPALSGWCEHVGLPWTVLVLLLD